ncbi:MAG: DEAD/DEAH box helicase family protein [Polyangiaceae bacterium]|nr:DEAD/DEAH box helicase family protein [Polyangiaceae bacterium]
MARAAGPKTFVGSLEIALERVRQRRIEAETVSPEEIYRDDPVGFSRDVLGLEPTPKQCEILEACRDNPRVSVRSSHKAGKSTTAAILALWFYFTREDARVILLAPTNRQCNGILYREIKRLVRNAKIRIPGEVYDTVQSGIKHPALREIIGVAATHAEGLAGYSGRNLLFIIDEASGVKDELYETIQGNSAGGSTILLLSNPTKAEGFFFDSHRSKADLFVTFAMSAYDSANVVAGLEGGEAIPGLATKSWIELMLREYGPESPIFKVRVMGEFVESSTDRIIPIALLEAAQDLWHEMVAAGPIVIGCDPAGPGEFGDETGWAIRVGHKVTEVLGDRGLTADGHVTKLLQLIASTRAKHKGCSPEPATIVLDSEGSVGADVYSSLIVHSRLHPSDFKIIRVRSSEKARQFKIYGRVNDELWSNAHDHLAREEDPIALPVDSLLDQDLTTPSWEVDTWGKQRVTSKKTLRQIMGRSPDRGDALCLCLWSRPARSQAARQAHEGQGRRRRELPSPYGGLGY